MPVQIEDPDCNNKTFSLFALGFRPFFLLAALSASSLIVLWLLQLSGKISLSGYYTPTGWHAHEMLFGYTVAVIAGFLLTAAGNWTGVKIINGWRLALLSIIFLLGRFAPFITELPHWFIASTDLLFIPLVALLLAAPIIKAKQWSNFIFIPILLFMATANLMVHLSALNIIAIAGVSGSRMMLYLVVLLIVIMGGRVIPFFTERGVNNVSTKKWSVIEFLSPVSIVFLAVADLTSLNVIVTAYIALFSAVIHFVRLAGWYSGKIWRVPLVWVLHVAYSWLVVGFVIKGLPVFSIDKSLLAYHAFTVGGIGIMTLGMMARVSLGHTGREMKINKGMVLAFVLMNIAAVVRVIFPLFMTNNYLQLIQYAAWLWLLAFIIFLVVYIPVWTQARIDGKPG